MPSGRLTALGEQRPDPLRRGFGDRQCLRASHFNHNSYSKNARYHIDCLPAMWRRRPSFHPLARCAHPFDGGCQRIDGEIDLGFRGEAADAQAERTPRRHPRRARGRAARKRAPRLAEEQAEPVDAATAGQLSSRISAATPAKPTLRLPATRYSSLPLSRVPGMRLRSPRQEPAAQRVDRYALGCHLRLGYGAGAPQTDTERASARCRRRKPRS